MIGSAKYVCVIWLASLLKVGLATMHATVAGRRWL